MAKNLPIKEATVPCKFLNDKKMQEHVCKHLLENRRKEAWIIEKGLYICAISFVVRKGPLRPYSILTGYRSWPELNKASITRKKQLHFTNCRLLNSPQLLAIHDGEES